MGVTATLVRDYDHEAPPISEEVVLLAYAAILKGGGTFFVGLMKKYTVPRHLWHCELAMFCHFGRTFDVRGKRKKTS